MISETIIENILKSIKQPVQLAYFFNKLSKPDWIMPLYKRGLFNDPPSIIKYNDTISIPSWPQSNYLARMADKDPNVVLDIMLKIPETDNFRIHADFTEAALKMPAQLAARWVSKEVNWINQQQNLDWLLPEKLGNLISHLAKGKEINAALRLSKSLLTILPDPSYVKNNKVEDSAFVSSFSLPRPVFRFDIYEYQEIIKKNILPDLISTAGMQTLELLCVLLKDVIIIINHGNKGPYDLSYIWRGAIEDHEQNLINSAEDVLVSAVRDIGDQLVKIYKKHVFEYLEHEDRQFKIFNRIALYLRRKWKRIDSRKTKSIVVNPRMIEDTHLWHEYYHLLHEIYPELTPKEQEKILKVIKVAAPEKRWIIRLEKKEKILDKEKKRMIRRWQYEKLQPIKDSLADDWIEEYQSMKKEFGELEHPDFEHFVGTSWVGPTSPKTLDELKKMTIDELINYLKTWKPNDDHMSPSPEGLSRLLNTLIQENPEPYAKNAKEFTVLTPPYVRGIIHGFRDATKAQKSFNWQPVIDLCKWVVTQDREIPDYKGEHGETGWGWTLRGIADLVSTGLSSGPTGISLNFRNKVWLVIEKLTHDPEPDEKYEEQYGGDNMGPANLSINTVRGEAMHAVMRYALWIKRQIDESKDKEIQIKNGLNEMPEVRIVLDDHLVIQNDPSITIRSVYGQWLPWLVLIDNNWVKTNVKKIFPFGNENHSKKLFNAAWGTYLSFNGPYNNVFEVMKEVYNFAIDQIGTVKKSAHGMPEPDEGLVEHLITYYWLGLIGLDDSDGLLCKFFSKASPELKGHAIMFIGRSLENTPETINPEILKKLQELLEYRLKAIQSKGKNEDIQKEFGYFSLWFISGKFDNQWILKKLKEVLSSGVNLERADRITEKLILLVDQHPEIILDCVKLMIENEKNGYIRIYGWKNDAHEILKKTLSFDDKTIKEKAEDLVHLMGSIGFMEFRDLLKI